MTAVHRRMTGIDTAAAPPGAGPPHAAERLERLPASRWMAGIMGVLFLGWLVESYDIGLIGSVLPSLSHLYHLGTGQKSLVATASTIGVVAGILPAGWLSDRYGRKRILVAGTVAYAVLTFATGLVDSIGAIVVLRIVAGLAMGAVFPIPYIYGSELLPAAVRGRFTGVADSFLSVGYFVSPLLAAFLIPSVDDTTGWRIMFFIGAIPLLFAVVAWRVLPESPRWYEARGRFEECDRVLAGIERSVQAELGQPLPAVVEEAARGPVLRRPSAWKEMLQPVLLRRSIMLWITFGGVFFVFYSIQTFMPTIVHSMGFTLTSSFAFTSIIVLASIPGKFLEAWLVERWGRKPVIVLFGAMAALSALAFGIVRGAVLVVGVGAVMSFFGIGIDPAVKVYTTESYPTAVRGTATAATEGFGRFLAGIVGPAIIPPLLAVGGVAAVYGLIGSVAVVAVLTVAFLGEETRGRTLEQLTDLGRADSGHLAVGGRAA